MVAVALMLLFLVLPSTTTAQFDRDPSTSELFQHVPMERGDRAPYEGILVDGRRYATLKLAELRVVLIQQRLTGLEQSYANLERFASNCRLQLQQGCRPCPVAKPEPWYESSTFWGGLIGGTVVASLVAITVALS